LLEVMDKMEVVDKEEGVWGNIIDGKKKIEHLW